MCFRFAFAVFRLMVCLDDLLILMYFNSCVYSFIFVTGIINLTCD